MKAVLESLDGVDESLHSEYREQDGKFVLKVEGDHPSLVSHDTHDEVKRTLAEFRDNNRTLNSKVTDYEDKLKAFEGVDPEKYKELQTTVAELKEKGVDSPDDIEARIQQAVENAVTPLTEQITELKEGERTARQELRQASLKDQLRAAASKAGVLEEAMDDWLGRAMNVFKLNDSGEVVAMNGDAPAYSKENPGKPLGMEEFALSLRTEAAHLYKPSKGADDGKGSPGGQSGTKTFDADDDDAWIANLEGIAKGEVVRQQ